MEEAALATVLHILVFVYWLGGDLGAFLASFVVTDQRQPAPVRLAAARLLGDVDMAPRCAPLLALPTGLTLAASKGWLELAPLLLAAVWTVALIWLLLLWRLHFRSTAMLRSIDSMLRKGLLVGLAIGAWLVEPLFLKAKLALLGIALVAGLIIRQLISPLGPALDRLAAGDAGSADPDITRALRQARPLVICIWITLVAAAWLGIAKPA
jgi:hypothetical protein